MLPQCAGGSAEINSGDVITVETNANPAVSEYQWKVNGEDFATSENISLGADLSGQVEVRCLVFNVMVGDVRGNGTASCIFTLPAGCSAFL